MFYYKVKKELTNVYDTKNLQVVGYVRIFLDEEKTKELTHIPFSDLGIYLLFKDCPHGSKEEYDNYIDNIALREIEKEKIQEVLQEAKKAHEMGLIPLINSEEAIQEV